MQIDTQYFMHTSYWNLYMLKNTILLFPVESHQMCLSNKCWYSTAIKMKPVPVPTSGNKKKKLQRILKVFIQF